MCAPGVAKLGESHEIGRAAVAEARITGSSNCLPPIGLMRAVAPLLIHPALLLVTLALSTALAVSVVPVAAAPPGVRTAAAATSPAGTGPTPAPGQGSDPARAAGALAGPAGAAQGAGAPEPADVPGEPNPASAQEQLANGHAVPEAPFAPGTGPSITDSPAANLGTGPGALASTGTLPAATAATSATAAASAPAETIAGASLADRNERLVVAVPSGTAGTGTTPTGYPVHANIVSTTFWVGEIFNANLSDGSQVCSTYDGQWALHHTGVTIGITPAAASGCAGSAYGGCDGVSSGTGTAFRCATEARTAANGFLPTSQPAPLQNAFYLDLPYDDVNDPAAFAARCTIVPWAAALGLSHCADPGFSYLKNRWVRILGPNGHVCYGQVEDAGPSSGSLYHDAGYVFGTANARPVNLKFSGDSSQGAGMDVSPALNGCLGFTDLDGDTDHVDWSFVERADVPAGPWLRTVTTSQVTG